MLQKERRLGRWKNWWVGNACVSNLLLDSRVLSEGAASSGEMTIIFERSRKQDVIQFCFAFWMVRCIAPRT